MSTTFTDTHSEKVLKRKRKTNNPTLQHFKELLQSCIRNLFQNTYLHEGFLSLTHNHKSTCYQKISSAMLKFSEQPRRFDQYYKRDIAHKTASLMHIFRGNIMRYNIHSVLFKKNGFCANRSQVDILEIMITLKFFRTQKNLANSYSFASITIIFKSNEMIIICDIIHSIPNNFKARCNTYFSQILLNIIQQL